MWDYLRTSSAQLTLGVAAVAILVAVGIYVVGRVKSSFREDGISTNEMLTNFRELHSRGELSDVEYRTIKATLSARLQDELNDSGKEG
jgi:uncharacterized membrane protein